MGNLPSVSLTPFAFSPARRGVGAGLGEYGKAVTAWPAAGAKRGLVGVAPQGPGTPSPASAPARTLGHVAAPFLPSNSGGPGGEQRCSPFWPGFPGCRERQALHEAARKNKGKLILFKFVYACFARVSPGDQSCHLPFKELSDMLVCMSPSKWLS